MELILKPMRLGTALGLSAPSIPSGVSSSGLTSRSGEFSSASVADGASVNYLFQISGKDIAYNV